VRVSLRLRQVANVVNLTTPLGLLVAVTGRAGLATGPDGLVLATGFRLRVPATAFTVGNVVVSRLDAATLARRPRLMAHESRHATQYAWCAGLPFLALYGLAAGWSWLRCGNASSRNVFERLAGLADGGYRPDGGLRA
jgi:hypothetical protein